MIYIIYDMIYVVLTSAYERGCTFCVLPTP